MADTDARPNHSNRAARFPRSSFGPGVSILVALLFAAHAFAETMQPAVLYRINCGGPQLPAEDAPLAAWSEDSELVPSPFSNHAATAVVERDFAARPGRSVPGHVNDLVFKTERYGPMQWEFPVAAGLDVQVRLFFAETYSEITAPGQRVFSVLLEEQYVLFDYDIYVDVGRYTGVMKSFDVRVGSDGKLDLDFISNVDNPLVNAIEIATTCVMSSTAWQNNAFQPQSWIFSAEYNATPTAANIDGLVGLSDQAGSTYSDYAVLVRFNSSGSIDARDGGVYRADNIINYWANQTYRFRIIVDVPNHTYSAYVSPSWGGEQAIAVNYAFRTEQSGVSSLGNWGVQCGSGAFEVCDMEVNPYVQNLTRSTVHPNIQSAVDYAFDDDELVLVPGVYTGTGNRDVDGREKSFTVRSAVPTDPATVESTVVDCRADYLDRHRAFDLRYSSPGVVAIAGLTLTGGCAPKDLEGDSAGGAVLCIGADLEIDRCIIRDNTARSWGASFEGGEAYGGALYFAGPRLDITRTSFSGNSAAPERFDGRSHGGAIYAASTDVFVMSESQVVNNRGAGGIHLESCRGGGIYAVGHTIVTGCNISANMALGSNDAAQGGGLYSMGGPLLMSDCLVSNNYASPGNGPPSSGAGVYASGPATIEGCSILWNGEMALGGGVACWNTDSCIVRDCLVAGNDGGGAAYMIPGSGGGVRGASLVENSQIINNTAANFAGGLDQCTTVRGCILAGNYAEHGASALSDCQAVENSIIIGSISDWAGGAIGTTDSILSCLVAGNAAGGLYDFLNVTNTTVLENYAEYNGGIAIYSNSELSTISSSIVWGNGPQAEDQIEGPATVAYSCVENWTAGGIANIASPPGFETLDTGTWTAGATFNADTAQSTLTDASKNWPVNALAGKLLNPDGSQALQFYIASNTAQTITVWANASYVAQLGDAYRIHDYHLPADSPCVDTGDPLGEYMDQLDIDGEPRVRGCVADMGADESPFLRHVAADFNQDCRVDQSDLDHFTQCALGPAIPQTATECLDADLNNDAIGSVDMADFAILQRCWSGPDFPAQSLCER